MTLDNPCGTATATELKRAKCGSDVASTDEDYNYAVIGRADPYVPKNRTLRNVGKHTLCITADGILFRTATITSIPAPQRGQCGSTNVAAAASNEGAARHSEKANLLFKTARLSNSVFKPLPGVERRFLRHTTLRQTV